MYYLAGRGPLIPVHTADGGTAPTPSPAPSPAPASPAPESPQPILGSSQLVQSPLPPEHHLPWYEPFIIGVIVGIMIIAILRVYLKNP